MKWLSRVKLRHAAMRRGVLRKETKKAELGKHFHLFVSFVGFC